MHRAFQHLKGYKPEVAVSTICPVGFEALQSQKGLLNESDVLLLRVVICFKSPIGYNFTTDAKKWLRNDFEKSVQEVASSGSITG